MDFKSDAKTEVETMRQAKLLKREYIPDIPLYMEQVTAFLDENVGVIFKTEDGVFTKMMINNYAKAGIMQRPVKKKYDRSHITRLIEIYFLKQTFSVSEIKEMFDLGGDDPVIYDAFTKVAGLMVDCWANYMNSALDVMDEMLKERGVDNPEAELQLFMLLCSLEDAAKKRICISMLNKLTGEAEQDGQYTAGKKADANDADDAGGPKNDRPAR